MAAAGRATSTSTSSPAASRPTPSVWRAWRRPGWTACSSRCRTATRTAPAWIAGRADDAGQAEDGGGDAGAGPAAHAQRRPSPREHRARRRVRRAGRAAGRAPAWSWPTRSISAGRSPTGRRCCRRAAPSTKPAQMRPPRALACAGAWRSSSCAPTTTPIARAPAWTAGPAVTSWSRPTGSRCPATRRGRSPRCIVLGERPRSARWPTSGPTAPASARFGARPGCPSPCRTCDERTVDFGGCRCQAFALLGDAAATDPACALAPRHELVRAARAAGREAARPSSAPLAPPASGFMKTAAIEVSDLRRRYAEVEAVRGDRLLGRRGRDLRIPRPQRRGQDDDHQDPVHAAAAHLGDGAAGRARRGGLSRRRSAGGSASSSRTRPSTIA